MITSNNRSYDPPRLLALQSTKNGKGEKKRLLINSIICGFKVRHLSTQRLKESTVSQFTMSGLSPFHVLMTLEKKFIVRVDMFADYLVSVSSSVVRPVYYEVLIAIHVVNVFHYFENLD